MDTEKTIEPIKFTPNPAGQGRPLVSEEQYSKWLDEMRPFLRQGSTLWYSMDKCQLLMHKDAIYEKYRSGDWFTEKVDALRATVGELINNVGFQIIERINTRMIQSNGKTELTTEEVQVWKTMAEKHRSAQNFFVSRIETAQATDEDIGKILDRVEKQNSYETIGQQARKQMVAANKPVQNQEQTGGDSNVQTE